MAEQETSLREDLEAAAEAVEETSEVEEQAAPETAQEEETEVPGEGEPTAEAAEQAPEPEPEPAEPVAATHKPPVDWAPEVKAKFGDLAPEVQAAIAERERGINETLQQTADIRHQYDNFNQMINPYLPLMQAEGVSDPAVAIKGLLETTAALQMGNPQQKAQKIAGLIQHYGVDIETLDNLLSGQPAANPQMNQFEQMLNQRLAPVDQLLQRANQAQAQQVQQQQAEASQTIEQFAADPKNIHFEAVRNTMADFLDMASSRGQQMTIQEAYDRSCALDPAISASVMQERAQQAALGQEGMLAGKKNAASSIHGRPASTNSGLLSDDMSLRETIAAQLEGSGRI